jgi:hypothetical protein
MSPSASPARARARLSQPQAAELPRVVCGARRHRDGEPCEALSVPGKRRCRFHAGMSTGPRTPEGKAKVTRNLPWARARVPVAD